MKCPSITLWLTFTLPAALAQTVNPSFIAPDTVCVNQTFTIQNTSTGNITSHYWSFCPGNQNLAPTALNLGNPGGNFSFPVYYSIAKENTDYYAFVSNNSPGGLVRLFYGSSLLNTPVITFLGNLGGLPNNLEDIHIEFENGNWYAIAVGGIPGGIFRVSFGSSLSNVPTVTSLGNIGGMNYPQRLQVFRSGGNLYGFTPNRNGNTLTRFDFGSSITNAPTAVNLGNIGGFNICDDIAIISFNGSWHGYVVNEGNNTLTRLDFGNSLLNTPTGTNLGNTGALNLPRGIDVYVECGTIKGLIVNRQGNDLLKMNFGAGPTGPIATTSYGNIGSFSFPHSIERYRSGDTLYAMIPNVNNNTLTRIYYPGCTNSTPVSSTLQNPPPVSYNLPGTYYVTLVANETQISQATFCKPVVAIAHGPSVTGTPTLCVGDTLRLKGHSVQGASLNWSGPSAFASNSTNISITGAQVNHSGVYSLQVNSPSACAGSATYSVTVIPGPLISAPGKTTCPQSKVTLSVSGATTYSWSTSQTTPTIQVTPTSTVTTTYTVKGRNDNGCWTTATTQVVVGKCLGVEIHDPTASIAVFPNPNNGTFRIALPVTGKITLIDLTGREVFSHTANASDEVLTLPHHVTNGCYYILYLQGEKTMTTRMVLIR